MAISRQKSERLGTIILHSLDSTCFTCWHAVKQQEKLYIMDLNNGISEIVQG